MMIFKIDNHYPVSIKNITFDEEGSFWSSFSFHEDFFRFENKEKNINIL